MALDPQTRTQITSILEQNPIVLFMKGTKRMPRCGFSATVVQILDGLGVDFKDVDVLSNPALREGIKEFGNWPTIPQLYFKGNLVGGCDIVRELDQNGELADALGVKVEPVAAPQISLTSKAAAVIRDASAQAEPGQSVRLSVLQGGRAHEMVFDNQRPADLVVEAEGIKLLFDRQSAKLANGLRIDYVDGEDGGGFQIDNPNAPASVKPISARELKAKLDAGEPLKLYDVRTDQERAIAQIPGATHLDAAAQAALEDLPKDTVLVFHCHHGMRSQAAAESYLRKGFRRVFNLTGGIDSWSQAVDPAVRRY